jgi:hypothetical protein
MMISRSMPATVRLNDIIDALEMQLEESSPFLDRDTGRVETVSDDLLHEAEEPGETGEPDLPEWQREEWETAKRIVSTGRFLGLPTKFDVHEWEIMRDFSRSLESDRIREELLNAIHGAGAFRMFKDAVRRRGIGSDWFAFRAEVLKQIAIDWCEANQVIWE